MPKPEVYFAIPSANPENCRKHLPAWREMGYKIAILQNHKKADVPADITVWYDYYPGWPGSVNILCREIVPKSATIVVSGGDDMLPDPHHSAEEIGKQFMERFPDTFGVMQPHGDDFEDTTQFCGSPWLGRQWFSKMYGGQGGMCPAYRHLFADDELFWVAGCWNALWTRKDLVQRHEHFHRTNEAKPDYWEKNVQSNEASDTKLFVARSTLGFPGHLPSEALAGRQFDKSFFLKNYNRRAERHWTKYFAPQFISVAEKRVSAALAQCARDGKQRVVLFGAGRHTHRLGNVLKTPAAPVLAIVDDNPTLAGTALWNFPIMSVQEALMLKPDAVIISSDTAQVEMVASAHPLALAGAEIVTLYNDDLCVA